MRLDEEEIESLVGKVKPQGPDATPDENFKRGLFMRLDSEISNQNNRKEPTINYNFMKKLNIALAGLVGIAIVALIVITNPQKSSVSLPGDQQITHAGSRAFGSLTNVTLANARGQGGGGNANAAEADKMAATPSAVSPDPGFGGGGSSESMIYQPIDYKFVYKGEAFSIDESSLEVFERQKGFGSNLDLASFLSNFSVGMFDINKFSDAKLDYVTASQDRDFGYTLSLDLKQGSVYIGENWEKWMTPDRMCTDEACWQANRLKIDQIPADEVVINIANQFLDEFGISRDAFGEPFVQNMWRVEYARMADPNIAYVPDMISVVYPTKITGQEVYDEGGTKTGMYVSVNVRQNKVSSVGELTSQRFQGSSYETEQDSAALIKLAENGGYRSYMLYPAADRPDAKTETLELGTPTRALVRMWQPLNGTTRDLYVPSLIFPITQKSDAYYFQNIIVPLVKDILNSQKSGWGGGIMPMEKIMQ